MRQFLRAFLTAFGVCAVCLLSACDTGTSKQSGSELKANSTPPVVPSSGPVNDRERFVFPAQPQPFAPASVALDTRTGNLCKTYAWPDRPDLPQGLPSCSGSDNPPLATFVGSSKAYRGFTYTFDGTKWVKGQQALKYDPAGPLKPSSDDQYDPLGLFSREEKAKRTLTEAQVRQVAKQFGVSYEEASEEAAQQGYNVSRGMVKVQIPGYPPGEIDPSRLADFKKKYPNAVVLK